MTCPVFGSQSRLSVVRFRKLKLLGDTDVMWVKSFDPMLYSLNTLSGLLHLTFLDAGIGIPGQSYLVY
jgi:hypothetical protein